MQYLEAPSRIQTPSPEQESKKMSTSKIFLMNTVGKLAGIGGFIFSTDQAFTLRNGVEEANAAKIVMNAGGLIGGLVITTAGAYIWGRTINEDGSLASSHASETIDRTTQTQIFSSQRESLPPDRTS